MKNTVIHLKIYLITGLFLVIFTNHVQSQKLKSSLQNNCGNITIVKGMSAAICCGSGNPGDCYHWQPATGLSDPDAASPTLNTTSLSSGTHTYTLSITAADFSSTTTCQVIVTVVELFPPTFNPAQIPANGTATSQASITTVPANRQVVWSISGSTLGCTINPSTGLVTAGTQSGTVTVKACDVVLQQNGITYCQEASLCVGNPQDCCADKSGTVSFGPITFSIPNAPLQPTGSQDANGYCPYSTNAAINIDMLGTFQKSFSLTGVTVSWKEKFDNPNDYKDVTINWTGNYNLVNFGLIGANLTACSLTVSPGGAVSGMCTFTVNQTQDVPIGNIAVLKQGLSGTFTYSYNNTNGWTGSWDFAGITGFEVHLLKGGSPIATVTAQSFDANGNINNATLAAVTPATWTTNSFTAELNQLSLSFNYNIANNEITFIGGGGQVTIKNIPDVQGEFILALTFTPATVTATVGLSNVIAFGCTVAGTLSVDINYDFELQRIFGTGISAQHNDFDQAFSGIEFEVKDGALEKFSIGQISVKYKNKIEFSMMNASYVKAESKLVFSAKVALPALQLDVTNFKINLSNGDVTVERIVGDVNKPPVQVHIDVSFVSTPNYQFSGNFSGSFAGGVAINGNLVIGATATFNYGYFSIGVSGNGVPLGQSGLKVKSLAGEFGYNWQAGTPTPQSTPTGSPQQGTTTIGFGLGITTVGVEIVLIEGYIQFVLGATSQVSMTGNVKISANPPHYFNGSLTITYVFGSTSIAGSISSVAKFPASSGNVVNFNSGPVNFQINSSQWYCVGTSMSGTIFNAIGCTANINVHGPVSNPTNISGSLNGAVNYDNNFAFAYPGGFNPSSCSTADATDNALGFGVSGNLALHLGGSFNATMNSGGIVGSITAEASANSLLSIKWPCFITCGWSCVDTYTASVEGDVTVEKTGSSTRIHGTVDFKYGGESESGELDFTI